MADIQERIRKAIELHDRGVSRSTIEFQQLTWKINDPKDRKTIWEAYSTGKNPWDGQTAAEKESEGDNWAADLQRAIMNNSSKQPSLEKRAEREAKKESSQQQTAAKPVSVPQPAKSERADVPVLSRLPSTWRFEGLEPRSLGGLMYYYCMTGLWDVQGDAHKESGGRIQRLYPEDAQSLLRQADQWLNAALPCLNAYESGSRTPELLKKIEDLGEPLKYQIKRMNEKKVTQNNKREAQKQHIVKISVPKGEKSVPQAISAAGLPKLSGPQNTILNYKRHRNDITGLTPADEWTILIDESGNSKNGAFETDRSAEGIIAAVLFPSAKPLPRPLYPDLHASEDDTEERISAGDKLIENMLNAPNCGVLAFPIRALRSSRDWGAAIGLMIDLILRLLPLSGKTKLNVLVENKDAYQAGDSFAFIRDACYYQLMQSMPARAEKITLEIQVMTKDHPFNPYPDYVANTCFARGRLSGLRLRITGWAKTCFLNYAPADLARILDYYYAGRAIRPEDWSELLSWDGVSGINFISGILDNLGREVKKDVDQWKIYLDFTIAHLNSKAIHLTELEKQISFLMDYQPEQEELPVRLSLLWLTARLAAKNHHGELITGEEESEFRRQIRLIYPEDAQLACWITLHLAVAMTDSFDFARAKRIIRDFYDVRKYMAEPGLRILGPNDSRYETGPEAIPGKKYFAQLLSSYGQHEAFTGNPTSAAAYFRKALELFGQLNDPEERINESGHTRAYLVLTLMDMPSMHKEFLAEFTRYFGISPVNAVKEYADNTDRPYYHHVLVRAMADNLLPASAVRAYLRAAPDWKKASWHPWELIEFYRGVLSESLADKKKYLRSGYELAMHDGGATLRMIGCCILGALYFHDQSVKSELEELTERVIQELPKLGAVRIAAMRKQIAEPVEPMAYIKKTVPFNFR